MITILDKVKINVEFLGLNGWDEITQENENYILSNIDREYIVKEIKQGTYILHDTVLNTTSFYDSELIKIEDEKTYIIVDCQNEVDYWQGTIKDIQEFLFNMYDDYEFEDEKDEKEFDNRVYSGDVDVLREQMLCIDYYFYNDYEEMYKSWYELELITIEEYNNVLKEAAANE